jgi:DNA modification methylase
MPRKKITSSPDVTRGLVEVSAPEGAPRLVWADPSSITPNIKNWRIHTDDQRLFVKDIIKGVGWADVCLFNERTGEFINGHLRREVAIGEGMTSIPVLVGDWSPEEQALIHAALDLSTGMARTDTVKLAAMIGAAETPTDECDDILRRLAEKQGCEFDDDEPEDGDDAADDGPDPTADEAAEKIEALVRKWRTAPGQVWTCRSKDGLRTHRIAIGDCTVQKDVELLFSDIYASVVFTSPPYGNQRAYDGTAIDWTRLMCGFADMLAYSSKDDAQVFVNLGLIHEDAEWVPYWTDAFHYMSDIGWRRFGWYVWDQMQGIPGDWSGRLAPSFEFVFHFNREPRDANKCVPCKEAGRSYVRDGKFGVKNHFGSKSGGYVPGTELVYGDFKIPDNVIRVRRYVAGGDICYLHPAVFPPEFPRKFIDAYSNDGDIVYDPFGGALTSILACEASGRAGYAHELSPRYVAIGLERLSIAGLTPRCL